jgi:hypothetical protein
MCAVLPSVLEDKIYLTMKLTSFLRSLLLIALLLTACGAQTPGEAWTVYRAASNTLVNPNFAPYSFEYPSHWEVEETANSITFASEAGLLQEPPEKLEPGQILAGLSINLNMPPEEMVETYTSSLGSLIQFEEPVSVRLNGRQAVYRQGVNPETGDLIFALAVDMGEETRGLLTARMAEGELEKWEEVLFKLAGSLQVGD